ncbi:MAG: RNA 2',3'-cyclic phosphodiesterase [Candidatus Saganbacteria bacterium]|nr:RNA 2',3'-cyclic phosphodiesterase [Candidatus Saganbacteria bacterium]
MRTFISVELPDEIKGKAAELIAQLEQSKAEVKWVRPENLHLTLKFLGWVKDEQLAKMVELTAKAASGKSDFRLVLKGLGAFPSGKSPRVVWVGTAEGGDGLCQLARDLEQSLAAAGFKREEREFTPHLTLGRVKGRKNLDRLKEKIMGLKDAELGAAKVDSIHIMKSTLRREGPIYETYKEIGLTPH